MPAQLAPSSFGMTGDLVTPDKDPGRTRLSISQRRTPAFEDMRLSESSISPVSVDVRSETAWFRSLERDSACRVPRLLNRARRYHIAVMSQTISRHRELYATRRSSERDPSPAAVDRCPTRSAPDHASMRRICLRSCAPGAYARLPARYLILAPTKGRCRLRRHDQRSVVFGRTTYFCSSISADTIAARRCSSERAATLQEWKGTLIRRSPRRKCCPSTPTLAR